MLSWRRDGKNPEQPKADAPSATTPVPHAEEPSETSRLATVKETVQEKVKHPRNRLGEILVEEGAITQAQLSEAVKKKEQDGGFLGQALVDLRFIDQATLTSFLIRQCKIPHINLLDYDVSEGLLQLIPKEICHKHSLLPIDKLGKILTVAMVDPFNVEASEELKRICPDLRIKPILCTWSDFQSVASRILGAQANPTNEASAKSFGLPDVKAKSAKTSAQDTSPTTGKATDTRSAKTRQVSPDSQDDANVQSPSELAELIRIGVRDAVQEAIGAMGRELAAPTASSAPTPEMLAGAMHESVRSVIQEAVSGVATQIREAQEKSTDAAAFNPSDLNAVLQEGIANAMRESISPIIASLSQGKDAGAYVHQLQKALESQTVEQESRIAELTDATAQAIKAAEAAMKAAMMVQETQAAKYEEEANRRHRFRTVTPLRSGGTLGDAAFDAERESVEESADEANIEDRRVLAAMDTENTLTGYTFDEFFVSKKNQFVVSVCKAVASAPGGEYNPLFIHGDVGIGKTHLVNAVGNEILRRNPAARVGYVSAGRFARRLVEAVAERAGDTFRENYSHWDILILDDIQFLGSEVSAQEELFHIFNALYHEGRQIIIAGDKAPNQLGNMEKRLVSRFTSGIVACLEPPDFVTRMDILTHHAKSAKVQIGTEILSVIATRIPNDVRKMVGALRKVIAFGKLVGQDITSDLAYEVLSHLGTVEAA